MADVLPLRLSAADPPSSATELPLLLSAGDLAKMLRFGLRTIRSMDAAGRLPAPLRIGGSVRWRAEEIRDWLAAGAPDRETWTRIRAARK
jgi:predicted DNA-binding transcriptional regulator AlpA